MSDPSRSFASPRHSSAARSASGPVVAEQDRVRHGGPPSAVPAGCPASLVPGSHGAPTIDIRSRSGGLDSRRGTAPAGEVGPENSAEGGVGGEGKQKRRKR